MWEIGKHKIIIKRTAFVVYCFCLVLDINSIVTAAETKAFETIYDFDSQGRLISLRKPDGTLTQNEHDQNGRLIAVVTPEGRTEFKYDKNGNCIEVCNSQGKTEYFYAPFNRLTKVSYTYPALKKSIAYNYDPWDRITQVIVLSATGQKEFQTNYEYDVVGQITAIEAKGQRITYTYDTVKPIVTCTLPNGVQTTYIYNQNGQVSLIKHTRDKDILANFGYTYDISGLLTSAEETVDGNTVTIRYEYDKTGRLTSAKYSDGRSYTYGYDKMGNRTFAEEPSIRFEAEHDWAGKLKRYGRAEFEYDSQGNTTAIREPNRMMRLKYNFANQLSEIAAGEDVVRYQYSAEGLLIAREANGQTIFYLPAPGNNMWQPLLDGEGKCYIWANGLTAIFQDNKGQFLLDDRLSSPRVIFDQQKGSYTTVSYSPFGVCNSYSGNRRLFPAFGGLFHEDFYGLYITPARAYVPWLGRFLQVEPRLRLPTGSQQDMAVYAYCGNDPVNYVDKNGAEARWVWGPENMAWQVWHHLLDTDTAKQSYAQWSQNTLASARGQGWCAGLTATAFDVIGGDPAKLVYSADWCGNLIGRNSNWFGRNVTGGEHGVTQRDAIGELKLGNTLIPGKTWWDQIARMHDIEYFISAHPQQYPKGKEVAFVGPHGTEYYTPGSVGGANWRLGWRLVLHSMVSGWADIEGRHTPKQNRETKQLFSSPVDSQRKWWRRDFFPPPPDDHGGGGGGGAAVPTQDALLALGDKWQPKGVKFDKPAEFFGQIGAIRGVSYDPQTKKLALIGDGNPMLPSVRLDDFLVALQVVYGEHLGEPSEPTFSLDPADPANPAGPWLKAVYMPNLLAGTHMGNVMFDADWVLKQYTFGVIADNKGNILDKRVSSVPGYKSYMELMTENPSAINQNEVYSRFWILPLEMKLARKDNTIVFVRSTMQVQTRRMEFTGSGLADSADKSDQCAEQFANHFTLYYDKFAQEAPILEEVREAAKVVAIVKWLKEQDLGVNDFAIDWSKTPNKEEYIQKVPSLSQNQTVSLWGMGTVTISLTGGVELAPHIIEVPSVPAVQSLNTNIAQALTGPMGTSVGQLRSDEGTVRFSVLPLTKESEQILTTRQLTIQNGVTYAADEKKRVCQAFDSSGNSAAFQYDNEDRLVSVRVETPDGWDLQGSAVDAGRRELQVRSPNRDKLLYRFGSDGLLSDVSVNDEAVLRLKRDTTQDAIELQHIKTVEEYKIGDLSAMSKPTRVEEIVATERLVHDKDKLRYTREQTTQDRSKTTAEIDFTWSDSAIEIKGANLGSFSLQKNGEDTIVENSPAGQTTYEFKPGTDVIKKVTSQNGDSLEFSPQNNSPEGSNAVVRSTRGSAVAEMSITDNSVSVQDYSGSRTVYQYADGFLKQVESPSGLIRYFYSSPGQVEQILFPDDSSLRFSRIQAANISRITVWRQAASEKKTE